MYLHILYCAIQHCRVVRKTVTRFSKFSRISTFSGISKFSRTQPDSTQPLPDLSRKYRVPFGFPSTNFMLLVLFYIIYNIYTKDVYTYIHFSNQNRQFLSAAIYSAKFVPLVSKQNPILSTPILLRRVDRVIRRPCKFYETSQDSTLD